MDGVLVIDKPEGITSHDVVSRVKRRLGARKVGHLGTLDPIATGVLVLVIDGATKHAEALQGGHKGYEATVRLGQATDSYDREGVVTSEADVTGLTEAKVKEALDGFLGSQMQTPPMFSAVKKNGVPLYKLAREGKVVERAPKEIEVFSIEMTAFELPLVKFTVVASRGTYIRSICHDLGERLGVGAHLVELRRTLSGEFSIEQAVSSELSRSELMEAILPLKEVIADKAQKTSEIDGASG
ncbi:MAG: tRNA pseudouridine(55) synthase TruB [Deltaproteobacteria bacterium]|nr:tRNA pseudouridine(55) synthase TruB [Deltaproteobacteria bacterium]